MSWILSLLLFVSITLSAKPNLLIHESSPYLKQHAHNPIQWYPWGDEAFEKAKKENKPIFLSIGYSTCHWCHVMNEESFEDNATAAFLNDRFVCIKVDREERPDLDETYLLALSLMNAEKGWPLNLFLTPDAKPIFGSSYLSRDRFNALSRKLSEIWGSNPQMLISDAEKTYAMMQQLSAMQLKAGKVDQNLIDQALHQIESRFDPVHGGFGTAPKFPNEPHLLFLLQQNSQSTTPMIKKTLETMASRALYDQLGGGFHRYAVDAAWREPHFEKMLYNQAQLSRIYSLAYARFNTPLFKQIAIETNDYVLRDMRGSNGLFYTAQDAGGKDAEGVYYLWSLEELKQLLSPSEYRLMHLLFDLREPNFGNTYSLNRLRSLESYAAQERIPLEKLQKQYRSLITKLHHARAKRPPIHRDEKIVTAYNAMMIDTLIETSQRFKRPDYLKAAKTAAETLWRVHRNAEGYLYRSSIDNRPFGEGVVDDYAHFSLACAHLYDVTRDEKWLKRAQSLADTMIERFYDTQNGGFFMNAPTALSPIRPKEISDRYTPSANGAAMIALKALIERNSDQRYRRVYTHTLGVFSSLIATDPSAYTSILSTLKDSAPLLSATDSPSLVRYGMNGAMRATLKQLSDSTASLDVELKKPWRINTHDMQDNTLYPTAIKLNSTGWKLIGVRYPKGKMKKYEGKVSFLIYLKNSDPKAPLRIEFSYQGCSDTTCLAPETLRF